MRALAMTGMETAAMMPSIMSGSLIRETPPWARISAGTRSSAMTATAPASSAIRACSGVTNVHDHAHLSISAMPRLTRAVPVVFVSAGLDAAMSVGRSVLVTSIHSTPDRDAQGLTAIGLALSTSSTHTGPGANGMGSLLAPEKLVRVRGNGRVQVAS